MDDRYVKWSAAYAKEYGAEEERMARERVERELEELAREAGFSLLGIAKLV